MKFGTMRSAHGLEWAFPLVLLVLPSLGSSATTASLGSGFSLTYDDCEGDQIVVKRHDQVIWETRRGRPFLSASSGSDKITENSGSFQISTVDVNRCQKQNITSIVIESSSQSHDGCQAVVRGHLLDCGSAGTEYSARFWVPKHLNDRVAFAFQVSPLPNVTDGQLQRVYTTFGADTDEHFYGLGAQASFASLKYQSIPIFSREQGVGRGDEPTTEIQDLVSPFAGGNHYTTYTAIPQYISTTSNAFYLADNNTALAVFDFTVADAVTIRYNQLHLEGHFLRASSMLEAISMTSDYVGKMPPLPEWVDHGAIVGIQGGRDKVQHVVEQGLSLGCPIVAAWLQDWTGTRLQATPTGIDISRLWWNWEADQDLYPQWPQFVNLLRDKYTVRTLSYINPFLANVSTKPDGYKRNLFGEANQHHFDIQNSTTRGPSLVDSGPGIDAGILDLTNRATRKWFTDVMLDQVWSANISGFMSDFGEYTPIKPDTELADSTMDPAVYHNAYPSSWATFQHSVTQSLGKTRSSDAVVFHRSASLRAGAHMNLFWAGDQDIAWAKNDGIKSVIPILGHMGICAYSHSHSDIGGYTTTFILPDATNPTGAIPRSAELLGRWGELAAVSSAVFRSHEGSIPQINTQPYTNNNTWAYFSHNARLFQALAPYRRHVLNTECAKKGWPLLRMPVLYHPKDAIARQISYQSFYLGSDLYIAPVLDEGVTNITVYLPGGCNWSYKHIWTGQTFLGGQDILVNARLGQPAIFIVNGSEAGGLDMLRDFVAKEQNTMLAL